MGEKQDFLESAKNTPWHLYEAQNLKIERCANYASTMSKNTTLVDHKVVVLFQILGVSKRGVVLGHLTFYLGQDPRWRSLWV